MIIDIVKLFLPFTLAFIVGVSITPFITNYLYKHEMWKKKAGKLDFAGNATPIFNELHKHKEVGTPKMGGVVVWASVGLTALLLSLLSHTIGGDTFSKLDFLSRNQTWIPLSVLILGSLFGLIDDYLEVKGGGGHIAGGLSLKKRLLIVGTIGLLCALWFYFKLDISTIGLPVIGTWFIGIYFIPLFVLVVLGIYSGGVIDGIDGLSGGIFASMFAAYAGIAYYQQQIDLAAFCAVVVGGILAFLWFNIPPARFYMSETGMMGLTTTLAIVAFMTDSLGGGHGLIVLPVIAMPLIVTTLSDIIQVASKKFRGKKVFLVAPIHHHFEALGWPPYKVVMRFWVVSIVFAMLGMALALIG
jgi:phospho-N-acetylmuramoyl-pentapeptide-transferase